MTAAIGRAYEHFPRTDDAIYAVTRALEKEPKVAGELVEGCKTIYRIERPGKSAIGLPKVWAVYQVRNDEVEIVSIRIEHGGVVFHSKAFESQTR